MRPVALVPTALAWTTCDSGREPAQKKPNRASTCPAPPRQRKTLMSMAGEPGRGRNYSPRQSWLLSSTGASGVSPRPRRLRALRCQVTSSARLWGGLSVRTSFQTQRNGPTRAWRRTSLRPTRGAPRRTRNLLTRRRHRNRGPRRCSEAQSRTRIPPLGPPGTRPAAPPWPLILVAPVASDALMDNDLAWRSEAPSG